MSGIDPYDRTWKNIHNILLEKKRHSEIRVASFLLSKNKFVFMCLHNWRKLLEGYTPVTFVKR